MTWHISASSNDLHVHVQPSDYKDLVYDCGYNSNWSQIKSLHDPQSNHIESQLFSLVKSNQIQITILMGDLNLVKSE